METARFRQHNPTMRPWTKLLIGDVRSTLVQLVTVSLIGSVIAICIGFWNSFGQHRLHWTINAGIGIIGIVLSLIALFALVISRRKSPELTPYSTTVTHTDESCVLRIGVRNIGKGTAFDTQATAVFYACSGMYTPFEVHASTVNPFSTNFSEQIQFGFTIEPPEPVLIAISFAYRSRPNGKLNEQQPLFYFKWNEVDSALVHASKEERDLIENVRVGFSGLEHIRRRPRPPGAFLY
jgi:hypothetical protein